MKHNSRLMIFLASFFLLFIMFGITSCSDIMGYGVLLWSIPEYSLSDGDIVPIYIKSNISQTFVIGATDASGHSEKIEVPLWQITDPVSKRKVKNVAARYLEYQHQYATVAIDGLPMRAECVNTAKQVYRLRKDEVVKALYEGNGPIPMTGSTPLEGKWLRVMASDGTMGWCFSYNLRLYDERDKGASNSENVVEKDDKLDRILNTYWYPESYTSIIKSGAIDIERMKVEYGFDPGLSSGKVRFNNEEISVSYAYNGTTKEKENVYRFNDTSISVTYRNANYIVVQYTNEKGQPQSFNMVTISESIPELVENELSRREDLYTRLITTGPTFSSTNYGTLTFLEDNSFTWSGYSLLSGDVIPAGARGLGQIEIKYLLDSSLTFVYDGILTFHFEGSSKEVSFLYQLESTGLRLEATSGATLVKNIVTQRSQNPVILYFAKQ